MKPQSRRFSFCRSLFPIALVVLAAVRAGAADSHAKKLIEFGWDEPDTGFMRAHISEMQRTPFDGCVFHADYAKTNGARGSFTWEAWGQQAFTPAELGPTPEAFQSSVREALQQADEYVWIYTETPRWWSEKGPVKLPAAYDQALRQAVHR